MPLLRLRWRPRGGRGPLTVIEALRRAEQRRREGRYAAAAHLVTRSRTLDRDKLTAHLLAAYLHAARRAPAPAKEEFGSVLARDPHHARARLVARGDGGLIASQPTAPEAAAAAEALARTLRLAAAALAHAGLGAVHRAIVHDGREAVFTRTDGELVVSLVLPRASDPTQGLLDVNRLWSAVRHELGLGGAPAADSTRRAS